MTREQIEKAAEDYTKTYANLNWRLKESANIAENYGKAGFIAGAEYRQSEIDKLIELLNFIHRNKTDLYTSRLHFLWTEVNEIVEKYKPKKYE